MSGRLPTSPRTCPVRRSPRVRQGSILVPTPISPPGTANSRSNISAWRPSTTVTSGVHTKPPSPLSLQRPGRISIRCPRRSTPWVSEPPTTPPMRCSTSWPGLFTLKLRRMYMRAGPARFRAGTGIRAMYSASTSMLHESCADMGTTGDFSATVPATNSLMWNSWSSASISSTRSTLFCTMTIRSIFSASIAARCSAVWGCGQCSLAAMTRRAPSMTLEPLSMVLMRISCPGQSTKETWRISSHSPPLHDGSAAPAPARTTCLLRRPSL
mmetsp:Transcript_27028/g.71160  ORF Transcript_27028/g.71160 Transcript_27028/m.71160 type:complete len:269 (+) Transcript_27028:545-1351(+)